MGARGALEGSWTGLHVPLSMSVTQSPDTEPENWHFQPVSRQCCGCGPHFENHSLIYTLDMVTKSMISTLGSDSSLSHCHLPPESPLSTMGYGWSSFWPCSPAGQHDIFLPGNCSRNNYFLAQNLMALMLSIRYIKFSM